MGLRVRGFGVTFKLVSEVGWNKNRRELGMGSFDKPGACILPLDLTKRYGNMRQLNRQNGFVH